MPISTTASRRKPPRSRGKSNTQQDFWGKAAYYGVPTPFTAQVVAGWQRNIMRSQGVVSR